MAASSPPWRGSLVRNIIIELLLKRNLEMVSLVSKTGVREAGNVPGSTRRYSAECLQYPGLNFRELDDLDLNS